MFIFKCRFRCPCRRGCLRSLIRSREFKKLRRQLQQKSHIKFELCVRLSLLRLFHVGRVVQNRRSALSLAWHEWFSCKGKDWKIYCCELALSSELQIWKFHVVFCQTTSKHCIKKRAARAARLFFFIQPIKVAPYSFLTACELVSKSRDGASFKKSTRKSRATLTTASNSHWSNFGNHRCSFPMC